MAKSSLRMDTRRALADGTYPIQIKVGYGTDIYLATGIYLKPDEWDARTQMCAGKHARVTNSILTSSLARITTRVLELRESGQFGTYNRAQLRQMLTDLSLDAPTVDLPSLGKYIDKVISLRSGRTADSYKSTITKLQSYCDPYKVTFSEMSYTWWEGWSKQMADEGLKRNTISKYMKCVKTVIRYAEEDGVAVNQAYKKIDSSAERDTPMRNLPIEVMRKVRDTEVKGKTAVYKDAYMLSFYLIGINMADLLELPKNAIVDGRLHYKRKKTGKNYSIKIEPEAQAIIDKYPGKTHLLSFGENCKQFRFNCAACLEKIVKGMTWYYARYSWANYAVDLDIPKDIISEALGHKHGSDVTGVYIRYTLDKIDKANRQVLDYFGQK